MLLEEGKTEIPGILASNPKLRSVDMDIKDNIFIYYYTFKEGKFDSPSQEEIEIMKSNLISALKSSFESIFATTETEDDEEFTMDDLFEYLKGFRFLYLEENTLKGFQIDISSEEIRHAKPFAIPADEITQEKILEQMSAEQFAYEIAKNSRELCPMVSGGIITDSLVFDYENLIYYCRIDSLNQVAGSITEMKDGIRNQMVFAKDETNMFSKLAALDGGWYLYFNVKNIDSTITLYFSPQEIKEMTGSDSITNEVERARHALNALIRTTNAQTPLQLDFITRLDSLYIEGDNLIYRNTILDQFETVKENAATLRWILLSQFSSEDTRIQYLILMCVRAGYGICYRYEPLPADKKAKKKSKKQKGNDRLEICFPVKELEGYVKD